MGFSDFRVWYLDPEHKCDASHHSSYAAPECNIVHDFIQDQAFEQGDWQFNAGFRTEACFDRTFVGRFGHGLSTYAQRVVNNLPEDHEFIRIAFDAYIIDSWDFEML